jgi:fumarate hydratase class II
VGAVRNHPTLFAIELLADACRFLSERCASGIEPNGKRIKEHLGNSREEISLREAALKLEILTAEQFDLWVRPKDMTHPLERSL